MKRFWIVSGIVVAVIVIIILLLPVFINVDSFRPEVEQKISAALGRQVQIGKISASIFSGGAEADNISISDGPAFSKQPFLQASSLKIGLKLMPLIFSKQLKVTSLTIKNPDILLVENAAGKWNYSSLGNSAPSSKTQTASSAQSSKTGSAPSSSSSSSDFSVGKMEIENGKIRVSQAGKEHSYEKVNLTASDISTQSAIPFTLTAAIPGGGSLNLQGQAGPINQQDSAKTPLDAKLTLKHVDLKASGLAGSDMGGLVDFDGTVKSDGHHLVSNGKATASNLLLVKGGAPEKPSVSLDYNSDYNLDSNNGDVKAGVHTGNSTATANGTVSSQGANMVAHVKVDAKNMAVNDVEGLLPAFAVSLPSGSKLQGGTINATLDAEGPFDALVITGPVSVAQTHLTGYDLAGKLGAMAALAGIKGGNDTLIQTFSSSLRVAPEGIQANNILLDVPSIGQVTGDGTVSNTQQLNFKMLLKVTGGMLGQLTKVAGGANSKGIPFTIEGTSSNPTFRPSGTGLAKSMLGNVPGVSQTGKGLGGALGGLLGKKKQP
jgi:AsmA protein